MIDHIPAFGICGWSGSGKTTVIEEVIRRMTAKGLAVCVIKHDVHGLNIDHEGKDSDRFFKAGGDVIMRGPQQSFLRAHRTGNSSLQEVLKFIAPHYDLILVEGHKSTPLFNKVWVLKNDSEQCPPEATNVKRVLRRDEDRVSIVMEMIETWLPAIWLKAPVCAGVLVGESMARTRGKMLADKTSLEKTIGVLRRYTKHVVLLGNVEVAAELSNLPVLPDIHGVHGPLAGMLAAMRWHPLASWIFAASDLPMVSEKAIEWLLSTRRPGVWATVPKLQGSPGVEPLLAHYDFRSHHLLEELDRPTNIVESKKVITPILPDDIAKAWTNNSSV